MHSSTRQGRQRLLEAAIAKHQAGQSAEAEKLYLSILQMHPDDPDALNNLAVLYHREGRAEQALQWYQKLLTRQPQKAEVINNYGVLLREQGAGVLAIEQFRKAIAIRPGYADALYNLGLTYIESNQPELAVEPLRSAVALIPANPDIHANLARALATNGKVTEALVHGQKALELKDAAACEAFRGRRGVPLLPTAPRPFDPTKPERNIIAFSLWGSEGRYTHGAVANAELCPSIYPDWTCRFYADRTVPEEVLSQLSAHGAQVVLMPERSGPYEGLFWRFFAAGDRTIDRFLCRDCDSRLNTQESNAVADWIKSGRQFHSMRDAIFHTELILAGMWGGVGGGLDGIEVLCRAFYRPYLGRWADQDLLRLEIWPRVKEQLLTHDSFYRFNGAVDFPTEGRRVRPLHVGAGEAAP